MYLEVYNSFGEKFCSQKLISEKTEIDLSAETNGVYFIKVKTENEFFSGKIIIQK